MKISRQDKCAFYYLDDSFANPMVVINFKNKNEKIKDLPSIDKNITGRVIMRLLNIIDQDVYPDILDYEA